MSSDTRPFGELFAEPTRNGLNRPKAVRGAGVKMVNMGELFAHSRLCNTPMERVPLSESEADRFLLEEGDLLFARQSLVLEGAGKCSVFLSDDEPVTFESHVTRVRLDQEIAHPDYYYYYFQSHDGRSAIHSIVEQGAGASGIRGRDLATLDVYWRPLPEQRAIAHVLGTLDDKIELNRRMNETLEEMARALFKSWFVDFDPVRAKMALRRHALHANEPEAVAASNSQDSDWTVERARAYLDAMDPQIADLFPDRLVDSELGAIPEGWEVDTAGQAMAVRGGSTPSTKEPSYWGGEHCFATPKDLSALQEPILASTARRLTDAGVGRIGSGLLPTGTVLLSSRAPIGYLAVTETTTAVNQGIIAMVCHGLVGPTYALNWARVNMHAIEDRASGTTFAEISKSSFRAIPFLVPSESTHAAWASVADPVYKLLASNQQRSHSIATQRDTLLPKLVAGTMPTHWKVDQATGSHTKNSL